MRTGRRDVIAAAAGALLVAAAFLVPHLHLGAVTPLRGATPALWRIFGNTAPILGWWRPHIGWGTIPAAAIGVAAIGYGPAVAQRLRWRSLTWAVWATSCGWAFALAMIDGWRRGFVDRLTTRHEYVYQASGVTDIPRALRTFSSRILDFQPDSWITHVSGHPPGALLTFVWLDRIGLGGGAWAGLLCLLAGSSAAAAVIVTLRAVAGEMTARSAAPFVAVAPTAIWVAVSADGYFAGVAAWGLALLALSTRRTARFPRWTAAGAGLLLGWAVFLNYGLALMALPAAVILVGAPGWQFALRVLGPAVLAAFSVAVAFAVAGFWWFDGYLLVRQRYWQGIANIRPFVYWAWGNLASVVCAVGLGSVAGLGRVFDGAALRRRSGLHLLLLAMLAAIVFADLSMLSKAETERIWLPFTIWLTAAPALLPPRTHRLWLAVNVVGALLLNHLLLTPW